MTKLLDARTSQNASFQNSLSSPISSTLTAFGQVGLNCFNPGTDIRVQMNGIVTVEFLAGSPSTTVLITIVRGTLATDPPVYTGIFAVNGVSQDGPLIVPFAFTASDNNVPAPASHLLVYTAFVSASRVTAVRIGPESFNAAAYSD
ncbi:hypothetical protein [Cohnella rhizosphaerae]|uniref:Uncharacterized protein n=1 Tax=Cohnella rhizosphaerae TaxID=1457232 RepID=A0A9X4KZ56_9BACL|nr:hypothetical protein [Cohnella rhizosphaerae]MDG0810412.1 hypothetical protein [Cohnella rhizosphaerae]